jgi:tripartite-type tricarboxylate transporter receptor subunit TctC
MRARPDGYTLGAIQSVTAVLQPLIDPVEWKAEPGPDYTPVILTLDVPLILVARKSAPYKDLQSFLKHAREHPGTINGASSGMGTGLHLGLAALNTFGGINITHVPFGGNALALQSLLAGEVDIMWTDVAAKPLVDAGSLIALAVASRTRWDLFPGVPTTAEAGMPNILLQSWSGVGAPAGMPQAITDKVNAAYAKALADPTLRAKLSKDGWTVLGGSPRDLTVRVTDGKAFYAPLVRSANIKRE